MSAFNLAETDRLLTTTRAVRKRLDLKRPVPEAVIRECLQIALQAPSGSNSQNWSFVVVTDAAKRKALAQMYRDVAEPYLTKYIPAQAEKLMESDAAYGQQTKRVADSATYLMDNLADVPVHIIPCLQIPPGTPASNMAGANIYPAVWSLQLALRSRGLGSTLTTLHLLKEKEAAALLGLPDDIRQFALLPVAYTTKDDFKPAMRQPLDTVLHWNQW